MIAAFKFNLPEEREEFDIYYNALNYHCAIHDIKEYFKNKLDSADLAPKDYEVYEEIYEDIKELLEYSDLA